MPPSAHVRSRRPAHLRRRAPVHELTADDVLALRFASTKLREGYDQDAVDDLLDRVVAELWR